MSAPQPRRPASRKADRGGVADTLAAISAIIHKNGVRGWFETFGMADIEKSRAMEMNAIWMPSSG